jgi:integrase
MMLMAGITPAFCAAQLGHSVGMLLGTYERWLDGAHNALEMQRLEAALDRDSSPNLSQKQPRGTSAVARATRGSKPLARVK